SSTEGWSIEASIDRGYAIATFCNADVAPDKHDWSEGIHRHYYAPGQTQPGPHDWGTIAAWAWGLQRVVDVLVRQPELDPRRLAVFGHSRNGKTALLAAAYDDRIALAIPHQAGCGGTAPSRGTVGESVAKINQGFPHWFNDTFVRFGDKVDRLPFDQHGLVALCAPRPVFFTNAIDDQWANPSGQFQILRAATPAYRVLGVDGLQAEKEPSPGDPPVLSRLGYWIRAGKHSTTPEDWKMFLDYCDRWLSVQ
ncbi:MAG TPA: acetylxylan esterase, partial [Planctomycetota bacterium]|nr:acetylxylan esterase [Planctomycetota bacterium]